MTEVEAQHWIVDILGVSRETFAALVKYAALVMAESDRQNLISPTTLTNFWARHIVDGAQLVKIVRDMLPSLKLSWVDVGSGVGVPGIIVAVITGQPVTLIEPRQQRARFLNETVNQLDLDNVRVVAEKSEAYRDETFDIITARAVAALPKLIFLARHFATPETVWILPKGRSARSELESMPAACQYGWRVEASVTEPGSGILVGKGINLDIGI